VEELDGRVGLVQFSEVEAHEPRVVDGEEIQEADDHVADPADHVEVEEPTLHVLVLVLPRFVEYIGAPEAHSKQSRQDNR